MGKHEPLIKVSSEVGRLRRLLVHSPGQRIGKSGALKGTGLAI